MRSSVLLKFFALLAAVPALAAAGQTPHARVEVK